MRRTPPRSIGSPGAGRGSGSPCAAAPACEASTSRHGNGPIQLDRGAHRSDVVMRSAWLHTPARRRARRCGPTAVRDLDDDEPARVVARHLGFTDDVPGKVYRPTGVPAGSLNVSRVGRSSLEVLPPASRSPRSLNCRTELDLFARRQFRSSRRLRTSHKEARGPVVVNATVDPSELSSSGPRCGWIRDPSQSQQEPRDSELRAVAAIRSKG
jgi:hypothetical protein